MQHTSWREEYCIQTFGWKTYVDTIDRWDDNSSVYTKEPGCEDANWIQDRIQWWALVAQ